MNRVLVLRHDAAEGEHGQAAVLQLLGIQWINGWFPLGNDPTAVENSPDAK